MFTHRIIAYIVLICYATTLKDDLFAYSLPITIPGETKCADPFLPDNAEPTLCCPKQTTNIKTFKLPILNGTRRIRRAAHHLDKEYIEKYKKAVELMKALPPHDPRSYAQQASIHCAYCDGAYRQTNNTDMEIQIHFSWLFMPFHRLYIYFHERILGNLIGDPDFALPYWNWDSPEGMQIPSIFTDEGSPLYDAVRNKNHLPPTIVDLNYDYMERNLSATEQIRQNLAIMYRNMVSNGRTGSAFFGAPYRLGSEAAPGPGSIEDVPHNSVHIWVGDGNRWNVEDMGNFYSSAKDPLFFPHHANIDRLWTLWRKLGKGRRALKDPDWLEASFVFFDEHGEAVRVKVKDCLRARDLGYKYEHVEVPWLKTKPKPRKQKVMGSMKLETDVGQEAKFPTVLNRVITTRVQRGSVSKEDEVLVIHGIEFRRDRPSKFDVMVNEADWSKCTPANTEFAGSFVNVPNMHKRGLTLTTSLKLSLTDLLHDLGAQDDQTISVTLVPRYGMEHIKIDGIKISSEPN